MSAPAWTGADRVHMARAIELARRGLYTTDPNPRVGCVLARAGEVVGEGWHERPGGPHAEAAALASAGEAARGATAYVTLEPCNHHGRTPPCSDALVAAGVARVVYALPDPNPVAVGGHARLAAAGIEVASGLLAAQAAQLNPGYLRRMGGGLPWVRVKIAASLDGRTALANGESRWITSKAARTDAQYGRARSSVVLTGIGTVLADDPALNVRVPESDRQPLRVVLDSQLRTPSDSRVINREGQVLIIATRDDAARRRSLERQGAEIAIVDAEGGRPALQRVLQLLAARGANEVWVEAGATLAGAFVQQGLFDELVIYLAPTLLGPEARALAALPPLASLEARPALRFTGCRPVGDDLCITAEKA
ncbi:MAG TPA: bifunctional diaminohydroxyphosphoribosylaminopyrimidine deaminase/5-amino-6-(5-phosphoribosylamino)uracil reductase RibD [Steroidobacteraceae bacterium]|nr:bifunctional diaminohydroxyphosphoribosylaminopyrimidine deaminase/5-amino-6-(5-phosphoribosylamino)uracil reductase RibD [Steroidobacteraceae bacterium]